jgi:hypothetical protein
MARLIGPFPGRLRQSSRNSDLLLNFFALSYIFRILELPSRKRPEEADCYDIAQVQVQNIETANLSRVVKLCSESPTALSTSFDDDEYAIS